MAGTSPRLGAHHAHRHVEGLGVGGRVNHAERRRVRHGEQVCRQGARAAERRQRQPLEVAVATHRHGQLDGVAHLHHAAARLHGDGEAASDGIDETRRPAGLRQRPYRQPPAFAFGLKERGARAAETERIAHGTGFETRCHAHRRDVEGTGRERRDTGGEAQVACSPRRPQSRCPAAPAARCWRRRRGRRRFGRQWVGVPRAPRRTRTGAPRTRGAPRHG